MGVFRYVNMGTKKVNISVFLDNSLTDPEIY